MAGEREKAREEETVRSFVRAFVVVVVVVVVVGRSVKLVDRRQGGNRQPNAVGPHTHAHSHAHTHRLLRLLGLETLAAALRMVPTPHENYDWTAACYGFLFLLLLLHKSSLS